MNVKVFTPGILKKLGHMTSLKQLLLSFVATTFSIVLTFGTASLIDHSKKKAEKHEMVLMILNDFKVSVSQMQDIHSAAASAFETQLSILEDPESFEQRKYELSLLQLACVEEPLKTVENIFSSSVETINTLGNVLFTEKVSEFYMNRRQFFTMMKDMGDAVFDEDSGALVSYDHLAQADIIPLVSVSSSYLNCQQQLLKQCQQMMDVSDEELSAFARQRHALEIETDSTQGESAIKDIRERRQRLSDAIEKGQQKRTPKES